VDVAHLTPSWTETPMVDVRPLVAKVQTHAGGGLEVVMKVAAKTRIGGEGRQIIVPFTVRVGASLKVVPDDPDDNRMVAWGLRQLGATVWTVEPSIITPWGMHAFVTIIDVPDPASFVVAG
jgi:hypothetical protein